MEIVFHEGASFQKLVEILTLPSASLSSRTPLNGGVQFLEPPPSTGQNATKSMDVDDPPSPIDDCLLPLGLLLFLVALSVFLVFKKYRKVSKMLSAHLSSPRATHSSQGATPSDQVQKAGLSDLTNIARWILPDSEPIRTNPLSLTRPFRTSSTGIEKRNGLYERHQRVKAEFWRMRKERLAMRPKSIVEKGSGMYSIVVLFANTEVS